MHTKQSMGLSNGIKLSETTALSGGVTYSISGTVYDADGSTAVSGATVTLGVYSAVSAANGTYTITDVTPGTSGSMTCTKTGYSWTAKTIAAMSGNLTAQNYTNAWWAAAGCAASCARAYQPLGAASLAASYINLVNPGTGNAAPGTAPTFNSAIGWTFNGSSMYLTTGWIPADTNVSIFARVVGTAVGNTWLMGMNSDSKNCGILVPPTDDYMDYYNAALGRHTSTDYYLNGVWGFAAKKGWSNGLNVVTIGAGTYTTTVELYIGAINNSGTPGGYTNKSVAAVAFYDAAITDAQAAAVEAAMAALNP